MNKVRLCLVAAFSFFTVSLTSFSYVYATPVTASLASYDPSPGVEISWFDGVTTFYVNEENPAFPNVFTSQSADFMTLSFQNPIAYFSTTFTGLGAWMGQPSCAALVGVYDIAGNLLYRERSPYLGKETANLSFSTSENIISFVTLREGAIDGMIRYDSFSYDRTAVPEPSTVILLCLGLGGITLRHLRRKS